MAPRQTQLVWMVGAALFLIALISTIGSGQTSQVHDWVKTKVTGSNSGAAGGGSGSSSTAGGAAEWGRVSLRESMRLGEKSWMKSVKQRHELIEKDWPGQDAMPFFPSKTIDTYFRTPYSIWDFVPASYGCPFDIERIGRMGDGGKWVCGFSLYENLPAERPCIIYSFGVQYESSYEDETISRTHCEIWAYDFSVVDFGKQLTEANRHRAHFTQAGIGGQTDETKSPPYYSIQELMKRNGHDYLDILKIDIEYSEFEALTSLMAAFPESDGYEFPIGQILIELHLVSNKPIDSVTFLNWWEALENRGLRPAWTEPNLLYTTMGHEDGMPRLAEYSLVNVRDKRSVLFGSMQ